METSICMLHSRYLKTSYDQFFLTRYRQFLEIWRNHFWCCDIISKFIWQSDLFASNQTLILFIHHTLGSFSASNTQNYFLLLLYHFFYNFSYVNFIISYPFAFFSSQYMFIYCTIQHLLIFIIPFSTITFQIYRFSLFFTIFF